MKLNSSQRILIMSLVLFLAMIGAAVFNEDGFLEVFKFQEELNVLKQKNMDLRKENDQVKVQIERLKTDPYAIEKVAREKLNMVKPQETVYQIVHQPSEPKNSP
jgi:cell division protein FtsB